MPANPRASGIDVGKLWRTCYRERIVYCRLGGFDEREDRRGEHSVQWMVVATRRQYFRPARVRRNAPYALWVYLSAERLDSGVDLGSAIAVFALNTAPLELQRRILNTIVHDHNFNLVLGLAAA